MTAAGNPFRDPLREHSYLTERSGKKPRGERTKRGYDAASMDERRYLQLAEGALSRIVAAFDDVELDVADVDSVGDVVTITLEPGAAGAGGKIVINTQRPTRQLWLAGGNRAWHFSFEEATGRWMDDKGQGAELFETVRELCARGGVNVALAPVEQVKGARA